MLEIIIDILFLVSVLVIIAGLVLKWMEKRPGGAPKPYTRYLIIGGPVLLVAAVVIAVVDPESRKQFTEGFGQGEKAGKEAAGKVLPKVPEKPAAVVQKAAVVPAPTAQSLPAAAKSASEPVAAPAPAPAPVAEIAAAPARRVSRPKNEDLRKCLDLESNAAIIDCARQ